MGGDLHIPWYGDILVIKSQAAVIMNVTSEDIRAVSEILNQSVSFYRPIVFCLIIDDIYSPSLLTLGGIA